MLEQVLQLVAGELSGENALRFSGRLTHFDRTAGAQGYNDAVACVEDLLRDCGVHDIKRHRVPLVAGTKYWHWEMGQKCYQDEARLELVEPWPELLLNSHSTPICIARGSQPTAPAGEEAELVDVGPGDAPEHYEGTDVAGKAVLALGDPDKVARLAIHERGALGVLNAVLLMQAPPLRTREKFPDLIQWQALSKENRYPETARGWGFALSYTMYLRLKQLLARGTVTVRAVVNGGWRDSNFDNLVATVPGREAGRQIWFVAHLCHVAPGAGDNASGCGLLIEIARTLTALIESGRVPRPQVDIKFLFCPEMHGSVAYLHDHVADMKGAIGGFCMDMVGEDQAQTGGALTVTRTPNSLPSVISDLTIAVLHRQEVTQPFWSPVAHGLFKYVVGPYNGLSDNYNFCDADIGVPMMAFSHFPDIYYHTSHDSVDKLSAHSFSIVGNTATTVTVALALPTEPLARQMAEIASAAAERRLHDLAERARLQAEAAATAGRLQDAAWILKAAREDLDKAVEAETQTLRQALGALPLDFDRSRLAAYLALLDAALARQAQAQAMRLDFLATPLPEPIADPPIDSPVPRRLSRGPVSFTDIYRTTSPDDFLSLTLAGELWNYIDGARSLAQIEQLLRLEYGTVPEGKLAKLLDRLVELGYAAV